MRAVLVTVDADSAVAVTCPTGALQWDREDLRGHHGHKGNRLCQPRMVRWRAGWSSVGWCWPRRPRDRVRCDALLPKSRAISPCPAPEPATPAPTLEARFHCVCPASPLPESPLLWALPVSPQQSLCSSSGISGQESSAALVFSEGRRVGQLRPAGLTVYFLP